VTFNRAGIAGEEVTKNFFREVPIEGGQHDFKFRFDNFGPGVFFRKQNGGYLDGAGENAKLIYIAPGDARWGSNHTFSDIEGGNFDELTDITSYPITIPVFRPAVKHRYGDPQDDVSGMIQFNPDQFPPGQYHLLFEYEFHTQRKLASETGERATWHENLLRVRLNYMFKMPTPSGGAANQSSAVGGGSS
jgi:hypothetical protein